MTFVPEILLIEPSGDVRVRLSGCCTNTIGSSPRNPVRGGSFHPNGGFLSGDGFPRQERPWERTGPNSSGAPGTIPPTAYFEGELAAQGQAVVIIPNIWSIDGNSNLDLVGNYLREVRGSRSNISVSVLNIRRNHEAIELRNFLRSGTSMGIRNTMSLAIGVPQNRPIGMQPISNGQFGFTPQVLVVTHESARFMSTADFGFGPGIVPVRYVDHPSFGGDYTLFFQIEEIVR